MNIKSSHASKYKYIPTFPTIHCIIIYQCFIVTIIFFSTHYKNKHVIALINNYKL